jgi:para-aminobenzoate synthetase component 1
MSSVPPEAIAVEYWPDTAARAHRLAQQPWFVLLDSCRGLSGSGRFDIMAWAPGTTLVTRGGLTRVQERGRARESVADPFALLAARLAREAPHPDLPFTGGALGVFGYDLARRWERLPVAAARDLDVPDMAVGIYDRCLVVDHEQRAAWFVHRGLAAEEVARALAAIAVPRALTPPAFGPRFVVQSAVRPDISLAAYADAFARIQRYIHDGDCYQVNYAQRFAADAAGDPWDAYLRLRNRNAAPFAAFLRLPGAAVLSSSPERFLAVRDGGVETRPIKGTRPRAAEPGRDRALAAELAASAKDRAENLMIVDLLRNDLGRCCVPGSIRVPQFCAIESFARVHHLVSSVTGRLAPGVHALDLLRACFPGGSITGAPKLRAMAIIEELEPARRSVYCGAIGYVGHDGQMDTNIAIRTLLHHRNRLYCWAGGGIVADSVLAEEYQESLDKAAALLEVFADAVHQHVGR